MKRERKKRRREGTIEREKEGEGKRELLERQGQFLLLLI